MFKSLFWISILSLSSCFWWIVFHLCRFHCSFAANFFHSHSPSLSLSLSLQVFLTFHLLESKKNTSIMLNMPNSSFHWYFCGINKQMKCWMYWLGVHGIFCYSYCLLFYQCIHQLLCAKVGINRSDGIHFDTIIYFFRVILSHEPNNVIIGC